MGRKPNPPELHNVAWIDELSSMHTWQVLTGKSVDTFVHAEMALEKENIGKQAIRNAIYKETGLAREAILRFFLRMKDALISEKWLDPKYAHESMSFFAQYLAGLAGQNASSFSNTIYFLEEIGSIERAVAEAARRSDMEGILSAFRGSPLWPTLQDACGRQALEILLSADSVQAFRRARFPLLHQIKWLALASLDLDCGRIAFGENPPGPMFPGLMAGELRLGSGANSAVVVSPEKRLLGLCWMGVFDCDRFPTEDELLTGVGDKDQTKYEKKLAPNKPGSLLMDDYFALMEAWNGAHGKPKKIRPDNHELYVKEMVLTHVLYAATRIYSDRLRVLKTEISNRENVEAAFFFEPDRVTHRACWAFWVKRRGVEVGLPATPKAAAVWRRLKMLEQVPAKPADR